jgi:hypothetical protein
VIDMAKKEPEAGVIDTEYGLRKEYPLTWKQIELIAAYYEFQLVFSF